MSPTFEMPKELTRDEKLAIIRRARQRIAALEEVQLAIFDDIAEKLGPDCNEGLLYDFLFDAQSRVIIGDILLTKIKIAI